LPFWNSILLWDSRLSSVRFNTTRYIITLAESKDSFCFCWRLRAPLVGRTRSLHFNSSSIRKFPRYSCWNSKRGQRRGNRSFGLHDLAVRSPKNCWTKSRVISRNVPLFVISFYISTAFTPKVFVKYPSAQSFLAKFFLWNVVIHTHIHTHTHTLYHPDLRTSFYLKTTKGILILGIVMLSSKKNCFKKNR